MERYYGNVNFARRYATEDDFLNHIKKIKLVWNDFKKIYKRKLYNKNGIVTFDDINKCIDKAKSRYYISNDEDIAIEGFFDGVCGMINLYNFNSIELFKFVDNQIKNIERVREY